MNNVKNMNNERAKFAFEELDKFETKQSEFRSLARSFPTTVQVNGLTAAVALLYAKESKYSPHHRMYEIIRKRLQNTNHIPQGDNLMEIITELENEKLQLVTVEVMALLVWIKRFSEGMFKVNEQ